MSLRIPYRGAGIAFIKKNKDSFLIFMGKRSRFPFFASWSIPGGSVESKFLESDLDGAKREFFEETGIDLDWSIIKPIGSWVKTYPFFKWTTFFYITDEEFNDAKPDEFFKLQWVKYEDLKKYYRRPFTIKEMKTAEILLKEIQE